jgi:acetyltransferase-like isoleucine patch superfamily enzyme
MRSPRTVVLRLTIRLLGVLGFTPLSLTRRHARLLGVQVGDETRIYDGVGFGSEPWLVRIGPRSIVTDGVQFLTHDASAAVVKHGPYGVPGDEQLNRFAPVVVGENCFIGIGSILLPGTEIGDNAIVGAGSVVSGTVPAGTVVAGNPARPISTVAEYAEKVRRDSIPFPARWDSDAARRRAIGDAVWSRREAS